MNKCQPSTAKFLAALCFSALLFPAMSLAQGRGEGGAGRNGAGGMMGAAQQIQEVLDQLDLTADQKTKLEGMVKQAQADMREGMQGVRDAAPEDRRQKMQDLQKMMADTKEKIAAELTPEQKAKFYPLTSKVALSRASENLAAIKAALGKADMTDDLKTQAKPVLDDAGKTLDGYKTEADAVKDSQSADDLQKKVNQTMTDTRRQLAEILGPDDARKLMQGTQGGRGARRQANETPTTMPAVK